MWKKWRHWQDNRRVSVGIRKRKKNGTRIMKAKRRESTIDNTGNDSVFTGGEEGNTAVIAKMIAEQTGADIFSIESTSDYPDTYDGLLEVSREEESNPPQIAGTVENMDDYEIIFVGYPIWWGNLPPIMEVFLDNYDFSGKTVVPFCTHAGSGLSGTESAISDITGADMMDGLAISGEIAQNQRDKAGEAVMEWLREGGFVE